MGDGAFYGPDQALVHHEDFGTLAKLAAEGLLALLAAAGLRSGTVVDLGCGSGILARIVSEAGYDVVGVDISAAMLELAAKNAPRATFRHGSLLDADLPRAVAVTAVGEALNYATDPRAGLSQLERLARRVHDVLGPGGLFLFDVATPEREGPGGVRHQFHDRGRWVLHLRAEESADGTTLDRYVTIFRKNGTGCYVRSDEHHVLRLYEPAAVVDALRRAGLDAEVRGDYTPHPPPFPGWQVILGRKPGSRASG